MDGATTGAVAGAGLDALAEAVRAALRARYERPVVVVDAAADRIAVLAGAPLELARDAVDQAQRDRVVALDVSALAWWDVPADGLRLWRQHGRAEADGELVTEVEAGDPPLQVVVDDDGWRLVRLLDGAQGWLAPDAAALEPAREHPGDRLRDVSAIDPEALVAAALGFEGVPYVWGGTTAAGVDCSGIVQRAAWRAGGCWLPRHSRALLRVGARVRPSAVERGDVLVLQRDPSTYEAERLAQLEALAAQERASGTVPAHGPAIHPMHVAIALGADEALHASRDSMRVVREPLESLRARYRVLGVRRLGPATPRPEDPTA